ncbi:tryptophan synthase subunit alpha [Rhodococcus sp. HNM0563]|nr:tryptophan synthase subunit alpha [Rhodococcus sp. HNM0563]NLU63555.1 tryptophan synthase subunit alpha [Rhodococcus sp. HNM0563]
MFSRLETAREAALIPYFVVGDPSPERFLELVDIAVRSGADALELGIAFSDPLADGPTIQAAAGRVLASGVTAEDSLDLVSAVRRAHPDLPIGLLVYANIVENIPGFAQRCVDAGVDSLLVPDAPLEEHLPAAEADGIRRVYILPPNADQQVIDAVASRSEGYVYVTSRAGVTGASATVSEHIGMHLPGLRERESAPPVLGFGISSPEQVNQAVDAGFAGVIVGSAIVSLVAAHLGDRERLGEVLADSIRTMKSATMHTSFSEGANA